VEVFEDEDEGDELLKTSVKDESREMEKTPEKEDFGGQDELGPDSAFNFPFYQ
jgi:hypothetical protein